MYEGRFFDGKVAREHRVRVRFTENALVIEGEGIAAEWPANKVEARRQQHEHRLTSKTDQDARLVVLHSYQFAADLTRLAVIGPAREARRWMLLGGVLVGVSALIGATIFVFLPMAAEPLAHRTPLYVEEQFGENLQQQVLVMLRPCKETSVADLAVEPLVDELAHVSGTPFDVRVTFVRTPMPNALTLPGGRVLVTSGLLETLESPDELAAVLAHELGHVQARDSMVSLYRNAGLGIFLEAITGGTGLAQQLILLGGQLAELRYTRAQEQRADAFALKLMADAGYDPEALARAFEAIGGRAEELRESDLESEGPEWMLTHPNLNARIAAARAAARPATGLALDAQAWNQVRAACAAQEK